MARTLAVIGGGRMGEAIVGGLLAAGAHTPDDIVVADPAPSIRERLAESYGVGTAASGQDVVGAASMVLLAVKPQVLEVVVSSLVGSLRAGTLVVSIAAGMTCARIESMLPAGTAVVRVMPNTPALVGEGMSIVSGGTEATPEQVSAVERMFAAVGQVVVLPESLQDACAAISGCGPAYMAIIIDALARAGVREGLSRDVAQRLALQTMRGTADLIVKTGQHPEGVADAVSSPGGTTIAAVMELESHGLRSALAAAVHAAVLRSKELGH